MSDAITPGTSLGTITSDGKSWNLHKTPLGQAAIPSHVTPHELAEAKRVLRQTHASRRLGNGNQNDQSSLPSQGVCAQVPVPVFSKSR
jgi:hypothetical protein